MKKLSRPTKLAIACILAQCTAVLSSTGGMVSQTLSIDSGVSVPFFQVGCVYFLLSLMWLYPGAWTDNCRKKTVCNTTTKIGSKAEHNKDSTSQENLAPLTSTDATVSSSYASDAPLITQSISHETDNTNNDIVEESPEARKKRERMEIFYTHILYMICGFGDSIYNALVTTAYRYSNAVTVVVVLNLHTPASLLFTYIFSKCRGRKSFERLWGAGAYLRPNLQQTLSVLLSTLGAIAFACVDAFGLPKNSDETKKLSGTNMEDENMIAKMLNGIFSRGSNDKEFTTESKLIGAGIAIIAAILAGFVATSNEAITSKVSPPKMISRSGLYGLCLMVIVALCSEIKTLKIMTSHNYGLIIGYTVCIGVAWGLGMTSMTLSSGLFYVLNLLTTNVYSFLYSLLKFKQKFSPWVAVGLVAVVAGIVWFCVATFRYGKKVASKASRESIEQEAPEDNIPDETTEAN